MANVVQRAFNTGTGDTTTTLGAAVGAGNSIIAVHIVPPWTGAPSSVTTGSTAALTLIHTSPELDPGEARIVRFYRIDDAGGETTVTASLASGPVELALFEVDGLDTGVTASDSVVEANATNTGFTMSVAAAVGDFLVGLAWRISVTSVAPDATLQNVTTGRYVFDGIADASPTQTVSVVGDEWTTTNAGAVISIPSASGETTRHTSEIQQLTRGIGPARAAGLEGDLQ